MQGKDGRGVCRVETWKTYTFAQSATRANKEAGANRATDGDHVQVSGSHGSLQLDNPKAIVSLLEGLQVEAIARHELLVGNHGCPLGDDLRCTTLLGGRGVRLDGFDLGRHYDA